MASLTKLDIDPANSDPNGIAEDQQPDVGTPFILDGAMCDVGTALQFDIGDVYSSGIGGIQISFESTGNWSAVTITIVGKDENGSALTEALAGPNNSTVTSTKFFSQILADGITVSGTVATNIECGPADIFVTKAIPVNCYARNGATMAVTGLGGTIQYDMQQTFDNLLAGPVAQVQAANWVDVQSDKTADLAASATVAATGVRLRVDSYTDGAELQFHVNYNPFR